jgi:hypothetical protein
MIVSKSFKYDPEKRPKVHSWMTALQESGKDFSESVRRLIEGDNRDREQLRQDIETLKRLIMNIQSSKVVSSGQEAALQEIGEVVEQIAAAPEIKEVNISAMKNRYKI